MAKRKSFTTKERVRLFQLYSGECYLCEGKIHATDAWDIEHVIPWAYTQDDTDENLRLAHKDCHKEKTAADVRGIRKADRVKAKYLGATKPKQSFKKPRGVKYNWAKGRFERE